MIAALVTRILERLVATLYAVAASKFVVGRVEPEYVTIPSSQNLACSLRCDWLWRHRHQCTSALVTMTHRNGITVSAFGTADTHRASSMSGGIQQVPRDGQPLAQFAQKSGSVVTWTLAPFQSSSVMIEWRLLPGAAARVTIF